MSEPNLIYAPWTEEQVRALNDYQSWGFMHPFTCGVDTCRADLVATADGWICPRCDYTQNWAHAFMAKPLPEPYLGGTDERLSWRGTP